MGTTSRLEETGVAVRLGDSPIVGTAIHNGTTVRDDLKPAMALSDPDRQREEDPFTACFISNFPNQIVVDHSRFEVDLNRAREAAVYLSPAQSWGLKVWRTRPSAEQVAASLVRHDAYYALLRRILGDIEARHGPFVVIDVHSYNHRRDGANSAPTPGEDAPDINIGTFSMDRRRWAHVVDPFLEALRASRFKGAPMDVRENIAFQGKGEQTRFIHEAFPKTGCAIAVEFKKIFMDEWSGEPDRAAIDELRAALTATLPVLESALRNAP
ncbi:MAG TPA: N-formylglutamate amidohydrolase [Mesorhizobium sp.]